MEALQQRHVVRGRCRRLSERARVEEREWHTESVRGWSVLTVHDVVVHGATRRVARQPTASGAHAGAAGLPQLPQWTEEALLHHRTVVLPGHRKRDRCAGGTYGERQAVGAALSAARVLLLALLAC